MAKPEKERQIVEEHQNIVVIIAPYQDPGADSEIEMLKEVTQGIDAEMDVMIMEKKEM